MFEMTGQVTHCVPVLIAVIIRKDGLEQSNNNTGLEFLNNLWGLGPSRNRVIVPVDGIDSLESIPGLHKSLKIRALTR